MRGLILLCIVVILTAAFSVHLPVAQESAFPRPFCIPANFVVTTRAFLRAEPSFQGQPVKVVPAGGQVIKLRQVQGEARTIGADTSDLWYLVSYRDEYGRASEGYIWSRLLEVLTEDTATSMLIPQFASTVEDNIGNVFELGRLRIDSEALLETTPLRAPLRHQLLALQPSDNIIQLVWLPLIQQLRRADGQTVEVSLFSGQTLRGAWVRSHPVKYANESPAEFVLGEPLDGPSRQTVSLPHDSIHTIDSEVTPEQQAAFQEIVNCYLSTFEETARSAEIVLRTGETVPGLFGYVVDGGGAYSRYVWSAHRSLRLWPAGAEACQSRLNAQPVANVVSFADVAALVFTDIFGECGGRVVRASQLDGATVEGALISRDESYSGNWLYGVNLGDDYVIVFTAYGADMIPLSGIASVAFFD
jgi:hypothetical protein